MISGIKRQPTRGPIRTVVSRGERHDGLECGHVVDVPRRRTRTDTRRCPVCRHEQRRRELEAEARAV